MYKKRTKHMVRDTLSNNSAPFRGTVVYAVCIHYLILHPLLVACGDHAHGARVAARLLAASVHDHCHGPRIALVDHDRAHPYALCAFASSPAYFGRPMRLLQTTRADRRVSVFGRCVRLPPHRRPFGAPIERWFPAILRPSGPSVDRIARRTDVLDSSGHASPDQSVDHPAASP